jgi:hypothetical protein
MPCLDYLLHFLNFGCMNSGVFAGSREKNMAEQMQPALRRGLVLLGILVLIVLPAGAEQKGKVLLGAYTGGAFGLGQAYDWHNGGHYQDDYNLTFHLGTYIQYELSASFGLQLNVNYQRGVYHWTFSYPGMPSKDEKEGVGFLSLDLNGVFNTRRVKNTQFYLLGGIGLFDGDTHELRGTYIDFLGGAGIKLFFKRDSRSAVNINAAFHHMLQPHPEKYVEDNQADFLRVQVGCEFCLK